MRETSKQIKLCIFIWNFSHVTQRIRFLYWDLGHWNWEQQADLPSSTLVLPVIDIVLQV